MEKYILYRVVSLYISLFIHGICQILSMILLDIWLNQYKKKHIKQQEIWFCYIRKLAVIVCKLFVICFRLCMLIMHTLANLLFAADPAFSILASEKALIDATTGF